MLSYLRVIWLSIMCQNINWMNCNPDQSWAILQLQETVYHLLMPSSDALFHILDSLKIMSQYANTCTSKGLKINLSQGNQNFSLTYYNGKYLTFFFIFLQIITMKDITKFPPNMLKRKNLNHWVRTLMNTALTYINPFTPKISLEILLTVYYTILKMWVWSSRE